MQSTNDIKKIVKRNNRKIRLMEEGKMEQNRFKSKVLWVTLANNFLMLLGNWGLFDKIGIEQDLIKQSIYFIIFTLVSFGIINSPTNKGEL